MAAEERRFPSTSAGKVLNTDCHVARVALRSFHGWKSGTSTALFSMAAEAGGRK